jgi:TolA-binding protein
MERLKDAHFALASLEADASELLRATEPYQVPAALKRNVRVRLVEAAPQRRGVLLLRVAIVAGVLGVVALSFAAVGHVLQKHTASTLPLVPNAVTSSPSSMSALSGSERSYVSVPSPALVAPSASTDSDTTSRAATDARAEVRADVRHDVARDAAPVSEASLVYETAHALNHEGDPARAGRILDDYFKRYPHGALAEEAQALAIDIAVARGDARAKALASRYLAQFPNGHFRAKAERVLAPAQ